MPDFMIAWDDLGNVGRSFNVKDSIPHWENIADDIVGTVNDFCLDQTSDYYTSGFETGELVGYLVSTEESTLRIYRSANVRATTVVWEVVASYELESYGETDSTVINSARIASSDTEPGLVLAVWRVIEATYYVRSVDGGSTWSSPSQVGSAVDLSLSPTVEPNAEIGLAIADEVQVLSGFRGDSGILGGFGVEHILRYKNFLSPIPLYGAKAGPINLVKFDRNHDTLYVAGIAANSDKVLVNFETDTYPNYHVSGTPNYAIAGSVGSKRARGYTTNGATATLQVTVDLPEDAAVAILQWKAGATTPTYWTQASLKDETGAVICMTPQKGGNGDGFGTMTSVDCRFDVVGNARQVEFQIQGNPQFSTGDVYLDNLAVYISADAKLSRIDNYLDTVPSTQDISSIADDGSSYAPLTPYALSADPSNGDKLAIIGENFTGIRRLLTSSNRGLVWVDRGDYGEYRSIKRRGNTLILAGDAKLDFSKNLGMLKRSWLGDWSTELGEVGVIRGFADLVDEEYNPETKAKTLLRPGHECTSCDMAHASFDDLALSNPVSAFLGEKRETVTDMSINTPAGPMSFTRNYRQSKQGNAHFQFMGLGWTHNHHVSLDPALDGNSIVARTGEGGEVLFEVDGTNHYSATAGSVSVIDVDPNSTDARYTMTTADRSTYIFDDQKRLRERHWSNGEYWTYSYDGNGMLSEVVDTAYDLGSGMKRKLVFSYYSSGAHTGKLYRVTDHTGRYVEFSYIPNRIVDSGNVVDGDNSLLTSVRDVRDKVWEYEYEDAEVDTLNYMTSYVSPQTDITGEGVEDTQIRIHETSYTLSSGNIAQIVQDRGVVGSEDPLIRTTFDFHQPGSSLSTTITKETTAQRVQQHYFAGEVYTGKKDPAGNYSSRSLNAAYRPDLLTDANDNVTTMTWSENGKSLQDVTDALDNQTSFVYETNGSDPDKDGRLLESVDAQERKTVYTYGDDNKRLPMQIDVIDVDHTTLLRRQQFAYDAHGRVIEERVIDPTDGVTLRQKTTRTYATSGNGNGLLESVTIHDLLNSGNNSTSTYTYDALGRVIKTQKSSLFGSCEVSFTVYDDAGNVVANLCNYENSGAAPTDAAEAEALYDEQHPDKNRVTTYEYDAIGRRFKTTTDAGASFAQTSYTVYDALDRVVRTVANWDGTTNPVTTAHNSFSHGMDDTANLVSDTFYNARGLVRRQLDVLGHVTLFGYDDADRLVRTVHNAVDDDYDNEYITGDPSLEDYESTDAPDEDIVTEQVYDPVGNVVKAVDALGGVNFTVYDALNRPTKTVRSASASDYDVLDDPELTNYVFSDKPDRDLVSTTEYDAMGRVVRSTDVTGQVTLYGYDKLGRQVRTIVSASQPDYDIDANPSLGRYVLSNAADQDMETINVYDDQDGRLFRTEDILGSRTWYAYDGLGRQIKTIGNAKSSKGDHSPSDPRSDAYTVSEDADRDLITRTVYNTDGQVESTEDALGRKTRYVYDSLGRQIRTIQNYVAQAEAPSLWEWNNGWTLSNGTTPVNHGGNSDQNLISETKYDARGRVVKKFDTRHNETRYEYDELGRRVKTVVNYEDGIFDANAPDEDVITLTVYDLAGRVTDSTDAAGITTHYEYDALGRRVKTIANYENGIYDPQVPDEDVISETAYNKGGQVVSTTDAAGTQTTFTYDAAGRRRTVIEAANTPLKTTHYTCYDKAGRTLRQIVHYVPRLDERNEVVSPDSKDNGGNWLFNPSEHGTYNDQNLITEYTYDRAGRTVKVVNPEGSVTQTTYYKDGQVKSVTDPEGVVTHYRYDKARRRTHVIQNYQPVMGNLIAYESDRDGTRQIYLMHDDGVGERNFSNIAAMNEYYPVWSPDGSQIAFYSDRNGRFEIFLADADGGWVKAITDLDDDTEGDARTPSWSPDGTQIAFTQVGDGVVKLRILDLPSSTLRTLHDGATASADNPNWSPDGTKLVFSLRDDSTGDFNIVTVNADGTNLVNLTPSLTGAQRPSWSPDGGRIAFQSNDNGTDFDIYLMNPDGTNLVQLTSGTGPFNLAPTWTTDGRIVFYSTRHDGIREIYIMNADGSNQTRLTNNSSEEYVPRWKHTVIDPIYWAWNDSTERWEDGGGNPIPHGADNDQNIIVQVRYDKAGRMLSLRDPRGNLTEYEYDRLDRRTKLTNPLAEEWATAYETLIDGTTQTVMTYPGLGSGSYEVTREFDRMGRLASIDYGSPTTTPNVAFAYDAAGSRVKMTETNASSTIRQTFYGYDAGRRLTSVGFDENGDSAVDQAVSYAYDRLGRRTRMTLPGNLLINYGYDARGRLTSLTDWDSQQTTYAYDAAGRPILTRRANGLRSRYTHDRAGRLRQIQHDANGKTLTQFTYNVDKRGNRTQAQETLAGLEPDERVIAYDDPAVSITGTWTDATPYKQTTSKYAALRISALGKAMTLTVGTGPDHGKFDLRIDAATWRTFDSYAAAEGEMSIPLTFSSDGPFVIEMSNRGDKNPASSGNKLRFKSLTIPDADYRQQTITYSYDGLSRLLTANVYPGSNLAATPERAYAYTFDRAGNRLSESLALDGGIPIVTTYTYNAVNQIASTGFTYDPNGNLTSDGTNSYTWDHANRLLSMGTHSYAYDGEGHRISKTVSSTVTDYLLDVQPGLANVIAATTGANTDRHVHSINGIHAMKNSSNTWTWMLNDGQGSMRLVMGTGATVPTETRQYAPFGTPTQLLGSAQTEFGYTGEQTDGNHLIHLRARHYNPALGVFPSRDPFEGKTCHPMSLNGYSWVQGNTPNLVDPSGMILELPNARSGCSYGLSAFRIGFLLAQTQEPSPELQDAFDDQELCDKLCDASSPSYILAGPDGPKVKTGNCLMDAQVMCDALCNEETRQQNPDVSHFGIIKRWIDYYIDLLKRRATHVSPYQQQQDRLAQAMNGFFDGWKNNDCAPENAPQEVKDFDQLAKKWLGRRLLAPIALTPQTQPIGPQPYVNQPYIDPIPYIIIVAAGLGGGFGLGGGGMLDLYEFK